MNGTFKELFQVEALNVLVEFDWLAGFSMCQTLLGYLMLKSVPLFKAVHAL